MKTIQLILLALAGFFVGGLRHTFATANSEATSGTHHQTATKLADGAHSYRHLLVKAGSDADHVVLGDATHLPVGLTDNQPSAAEGPINIRLLGVSDQTVRMIAATAIAAETDVYAAANGFVSALPASAGSYYKVGRTKAAGLAIATNVYELEVEPCQPEKTVVIALVAATQDTLTDSTSGTPSTTLKAVRSDTGAHTAADCADNFATVGAELAKIKTDLASVITLAAAHGAAAGNVVVLAS